MKRRSYDMEITPPVIFYLEKIMDELVKNDGYLAKIGHITLVYKGTHSDTSSGTRQIFVIERRKDQ